MVMGRVIVFTANNLETGDNHGKVLYQMWDTRTNLFLQQMSEGCCDGCYMGNK
jgi:hypothetical protein